MECDNLLNFNNFFANFEKAMIKALKNSMKLFMESFKIYG
jgi:hypothetical protein